MEKKKFTEYDMRDDFTFPVYVGYGLIEQGGIEDIDPSQQIPGELTRRNGETYLELADNPRKNGYRSAGIIRNGEDRVSSEKDGHTWYARTWDGAILFVIHKYFKVASHSLHAYNHFSNETSRWLINDYSMSSQYMLASGVYQARLYLDHIYSWFALFKPEQELETIPPLIFSNLQFEGKTFSLMVGAEGKEKHKLHSFERTAHTFIKISFEETQTRGFIYRLAVVIRNFFQILIGKAIGISRIILNQNKSFNPKTKIMVPEDERENWFLDQSFLPQTIVEKIDQSDFPYRRISEKFDSILKKYLADVKLQNLVSTYLTVNQFQIPVNTQIITLVSGIESYCIDLKYPSNRKPIKKAIEKLQHFFGLLDNLDELAQHVIEGRKVDVQLLLQDMIDSRDYIVHGEKAEKARSEIELVPDLMVFKNLMRKVIAKIILTTVDKNGSCCAD
ncbi:conserved hypothetical protein [Oenococcus oeni]|uniref:ApeA N-terminal domain 1-containing protein n=1 Tax=Oenococcus oeni TaxID=1247 RepID=UPI0010B58877|nr:hypothetical protein [Oenococcus oeni]SYW00391.1 conserved hypothetical protein [Oenococcus oeni]SYW07247.1 conserved hypothetical protein [Oenococcus oeni]